MAPLQEPDEGRYAEIAREMVTTGDFVTPRLNGIRYFEKPALWFWAAAASIAALGATELAARLPSAIAAVLSGLVTWHMARIVGRRTALLAVLLLLTIPLFALMSRSAMVDMLLCLLVTAALAMAIAASRATGARRLLRGAACWGLLAGAFLCKGPVGLVLPLAALGAWIVLARDRGLLLALAMPTGPLLFALVALPWYLLVEQRNPGFLHTFFVEQNLGRALAGNRFNRDRHTGYYLMVLVPALFPWVLWLPSGLWRAVRGARAVAAGRASLRDPDGVRAFMLCATVAPLAVLTVAHSKLFYYLLPIVPPLAILMADGLPEQSPPRARSSGSSRYVAASVLAALLALPLAVLVVKPGLIDRAVAARPKLEETAAIVRAGLGPLVAAAIVVVLGAAAAAFLARRGTDQAPVALATVMLLTIGASPWLGARLGPWNSTGPVSRVLGDDLGEGDLLVGFRQFPRGASFYLDRPILLWNAFFTEFGQKGDPCELAGRSLEEDHEALRGLWRGDRRIVVLVDGQESLEVLQSIVGARLEPFRAVGTWLLVDNGVERAAAASI